MRRTRSASTFSTLASADFSEARWIRTASGRQRAASFIGKYKTPTLRNVDKRPRARFRQGLHAQRLSEIAPGSSAFLQHA